MKWLTAITSMPDHTTTLACPDLIVTLRCPDDVLVTQGTWPSALCHRSFLEKVKRLTKTVLLIDLVDLEYSVHAFTDYTVLLILVL